ncbi:NAD(P)H-binding protein [Pontixanthobacter aestiaquae]|uniref:Divinyl chlorophyllide a 8-vinyl-reductase, chloroplastic n=1 Tax=Pontixanthobacter aestiaquae TaxID=1509367 RepID=A0A844ZEQ3_9SPHN|nr:NAD(P)H-binding protein [Pontixanthobacter aestiaquae]MDN3644754.1 NAD(P)H-binding protein [Pontixanthobacter aestiaquae]MXO84239.1 NAD(P)H-binding protein [Pontixanthobacter aestiaquae]
MKPAPNRVLVFGASGTIGQACVSEFLIRGYQTICFVRPQTDARQLERTGAEVRRGDVTDPGSIKDSAFRGESFDVIVSCLASRTGEPEDAWLIDYQANANILKCARSLNVKQMILLSAICVQKPLLAFQHAKLAFEKELAESGLIHSIVRPTAFFKSLSGQIERVRAGKPFVMFGDGKLTSCKPISDHDLAVFIADCIEDQTKHGAILPIGGPGPAITPLDQAHMLFQATGQKPRFRKVPVNLLDLIISVLATAGKLSKRINAKAEYARIGRYYATQSMLVFDPAIEAYSSEQTPETGTETLLVYYNHHK